jgi:hypothetical protein
MAFGILLSAILAPGAAAAPRPPAVLGAPVDHLEMVQLPRQTDLIGGVEVSRETYPGVFYTSQGSSRCTGTLVAADVVASAAHCMSDGGTLSLDYKGKRYTGRCSHHPEYRRNSTADFALCRLTEALPDAVAESLNQDGARLKVGGALRLMGYGCTRAGGGGGNDGKLRSDFAPIVRLPREAQKDYDVQTRGNVALCFGDSGGPAFYEEAGKRWVTTVNSRGDIRTTSYLPAWHTDAAKRFLASYPVPICGVSPQAKGCRQAAPGPQLPKACQAVVESRAVETWRDCLLATPQPTELACEAALDAMAACYDARVE